MRIAKIVSINLGVLIAGLLVVEAVFGTWFSSDPLDKVNLLRNRTVGIDARGLYPGGRLFQYRRNKWGFRGPDFDPASIDIVTMGGSTTNQLYLPEELTWQAVMERRLAELGRPMRVANAGFEGQSTNGHLYQMEAWFPHVPGLKPRYYLAYVGINDALLGYSTRDRLEWSNTRRWISDSSALSRLYRTVEGMVRAKVERVTHIKQDYENAAWTDRPNYPDNRAARPDSDPAGYRDRLVRLVAAIRALGAEAILVTQMRGDSIVRDGKVLGLPHASGLNGIDHRRLLEAFNAVTLSVCESEKVPCLDVARGVDFRIGDFYDIVHNSPQGGEKIGRFIAERLAAALASKTVSAR